VIAPAAVSSSSSSQKQKQKSDDDVKAYEEAIAKDPYQVGFLVFFFRSSFSDYYTVY